MTHLRNNASNFYVLAIVLGSRSNRFNGQLYESTNTPLSATFMIATAHQTAINFESRGSTLLPQRPLRVFSCKDAGYQRTPQRWQAQ